MGFFFEELTGGAARILTLFCHRRFPGLGQCTGRKGSDGLSGCVNPAQIYSFSWCWYSAGSCI